MSKLQFSIRALLETTLAVACWFGLYLSFPDVALFVLGAFIVIAASVVFRRIRLLFWLPLGFAIPVLLLSFTSADFKMLSDTEILIGVGLSCLISIHVFTLHKTMQFYRHRDNRNHVLITGIGFSVLGGGYCGLMIALSLIVTAVLSWFVVPPHGMIAPINAFSAASYLFFFPFLGSVAGAFIGIYLGFVCDVCVALQFRRRPKNPISISRR